MIFCFFVRSIFAVVKERVVNIKCIFMGVFFVFVRHFLVYLSELFWSEFVRAAIFIILLFVKALKQSIYLSIYLSIFLSVYLSIYLPAIYLPIWLYEVICPSFLKAVLLAETVPFIKTIYREIQIQTKALYKLDWVV